MSGSSIQFPNPQEKCFDNNEPSSDTENLLSQGRRLVETAIETAKVKIQDSLQKQALQKIDQDWKQLSEGFSNTVEIGWRWLSPTEPDSVPDQPSKVKTDGPPPSPKKSISSPQTSTHEASSPGIKTGLVLGGSALALGLAWTLLTGGGVAVTTAAGLGSQLSLGSRIGAGLRWLGAGAVALSPVATAGISTAVATNIYGGLSSLATLGTIGLQVIGGAIGTEVIEAITDLALATDPSIANPDPVQNNSPSDDGKQAEDKSRLMIQAFFKDELQIEIDPDLQYDDMDFSFMIEDVIPLSLRLEALASSLDRIRSTITSMAGSHLNEAERRAQVLASFFKSAKNCLARTPKTIFDPRISNTDLLMALKQEEILYQKASWLLNQFQSSPWAQKFFASEKPKDLLFSTCLKMAGFTQESFLDLQKNYQILNYVFRAAQELGFEEAEVEGLFLNSLKQTQMGMVATIQYFEELIFDRVFQACPIQGLELTPVIIKARNDLYQSKTLGYCKEDWAALIFDIEEIYLNHVFKEFSSNNNLFSIASLDATSEDFLTTVLKNSKDIRAYYRDAETLKTVVAKYSPPQDPKKILTEALKTQPQSMDELLTAIDIKFGGNVVKFPLKPKSDSKK